MALTKVGKEGITGIDNSSDATAITIDSSERVNIGTGTPPTADSVLTVQKSSAANELNVISSPSHASVVNLGDTDDYNICRIKADNSDNSLQFQTNNSERMRVDSSGSLLINNTGASPLDSGRVRIYNDTSQDALKTYQATSGTTCLWNRIDHTASFFAVFRKSTTTVGTINTDGSSTSYNTSSDYRLKENVSYNFDATSRLKQLKPARFNWIADEKNTLVDGFLAHEVSSIVPEAISGEKDAVDADGNIDPQGIDQSKLVPLLVKSLQEALAEIDTLKTKVAALEKA